MGELDNIPDLDVLDAKKELETRIHAVLVKLPKITRHRLQSDSFWRIAECMNVTENTYDFGRLPVYYKKPYAPRAKKFDCVRALATFVIVKWWDYSLGRNKSPYPIAFLAQLEEIVELGLDAFKVNGTLEKGFKLERKDKKPATETKVEKETVEPESDIDESVLGSVDDCSNGVITDRPIDRIDEIDEQLDDDIDIWNEEVE